MSVIDYHARSNASRALRSAGLLPPIGSGGRYDGGNLRMLKAYVWLYQQDVFGTDPGNPWWYDRFFEFVKNSEEPVMVQISTADGSVRAMPHHGGISFRNIASEGVTTLIKLPPEVWD